MAIVIRDMVIGDYQEVYSLWLHLEGISLSSADSKEKIREFLERNPSLSLVAEEEGEIIGTVLSGHDGRRGYIHHLAVREDYQELGLGQRLVDMVLWRLKKRGIQKCHLFVISQNLKGREFWDHIGWERREDIQVFSRTLEE